VKGVLGQVVVSSNADFSLISKFIAIICRCKTNPENKNGDHRGRHFQEQGTASA
jgi:hypothetical protein